MPSVDRSAKSRSKSADAWNARLASKRRKSARSSVKFSRSRGIRNERRRRLNATGRRPRNKPLRTLLKKRRPRDGMTLDATRRRPRKKLLGVHLKKKRLRVGMIKRRNNYLRLKASLKSQAQLLLSKVETKLHLLI